LTLRLSRWLSAGAFAGCLVATQAAAQLFDDLEARRRVEVLRQTMEANQKLLDERLAKMEAAAADRGAILELSSQLNAVREDMARMRGQLEVIANQAEGAEKRQKELYLDIDTRLRKLEQASEKPEKPAAAAEPEVSPGENKAYQAALDQFKLGNYALAVAAMQGFLVTYPSSPLAANAQYWVGMAYSGQRDYKNAIASQRKLLTNWPDSAKAPDALLSIASAQETMGERRSAQKTLEDLIANYPA
jgi:tol-pal system protein YbgF